MIILLKMFALLWHFNELALMWVGGILHHTLPWYFGLRNTRRLTFHITSTARSDMRIFWRRYPFWRHWKRKKPNESESNNIEQSPLAFTPDIENSKEIITVDYEMSGMHMKGCGISSFACVVARMSSGQVWEWQRTGKCIWTDHAQGIILRIQNLMIVVPWKPERKVGQKKIGKD